MEKDNFEIEFLTNKDNYYLTKHKNIEYNQCEKIELMDLALFRVDEVSFDDKAPRKEALENVLSTLKIGGINFIYLILGDENGVHFYYGISRNNYSDMEMELNVDEIGKEILEPSIKGNFRGSHITAIEAEEKRNILNTIHNMKNYSMLEGVPGSTKEDEKFQGVDRLADVMMGDKFGFMIIASPIDYDEIKEIEKNLYEIYSRIVPLAKMSIQTGKSKNTNISEGTSEGSSHSLTENNSKSKSQSENTSEGTNTGTSVANGKNTNQGTTTNVSNGNGSSSKSNGTSNSGGESKTTTKNDGTSKTKSKTFGRSETSGTSTTEGNNTGITRQKSEGKGESSNTSIEYIDKKSQDWIKYFDDVIMPRLDYGMGKGIFITTSFMFTDSVAVIKKLENTAISLYSGEAGNKIPLRAVNLKKKKTERPELNFLKNFQLPIGEVNGSTKGVHESISRTALSQCMKKDNSVFAGNWITTNELAMIAGLPQKEVVGLALREEVEFGLNYKNDFDENERLLLGNLVQSGNVLEKSQVYLDKRDLDKHIFVSGVTGSGKTTTCQNILISSELPFLVIEPAKTEYRILKNRYDDLMVFTLGNENAGTPFRLNPFEFFPHESITSRADMIRASIEAAFDMEAAIPQIIESAIYECYEDYGWDIATNKNIQYDDPFADGVYAFPTLEDLIEKIPEVVDDQGFDARLKNDYIGSIKARLMGLLVGSKGMMLNTKRSVNFMDLLENRVVLELEEIRSGSEKSLIMGFVLINLIQAIKGKFENEGVHRHITLVEEAHRLLSKYVAGDSPNKKQGVETFTDMLAEIRKYGESLIIVDQIPNKLTPEILKNTNTKIVHKLFAADDKDAIGNTIVLDKDQKEFLSNLETGRAIVFSQGYEKALQVQISRLTDTDAELQIKDKELREAVYKYYSKNYKKGIIINTQFLDHEPNYEEIDGLLKISKNSDLSFAFYEYALLYNKLPDEDVSDRIAELFNDKYSNGIINELKKGKIDIESKKKWMDIINDYCGKFDVYFLTILLLRCYYMNNKQVKNKKKMYEEEVRNNVCKYIELYKSNKDISDKEKREMLTDTL